ncbi:MAG: M24 family metallopeptidase [Deltaproteobacteria bacterium]
MNGRERADKARALFKDLGCDAFLLGDRANVAYLAVFDARDSLFILTRRRAALITDFRYAADFRRRAPAWLRIVEYKNGLYETAARALKQSGSRHPGFEARHFVFAACEALHRQGGKALSFIPLKETVEPLRAVKDGRELAAIKKALRVTLEALRFAGSKLKPGLREKEVAGEIERFIRFAGARASAFDIIVASGPNSSYPHAGITDRRLRNGEPVVIDMGVDIDGYKCDLTRTFFLGKIPPIVRRVADIVTEAQEKAIKIIKPDVPLRVVDAAARRFIAEKGYGDAFGHALGHGVGLEVHEAPTVNSKSDRAARPGMIFTVEPGIYLAGRFGVRREDMVRVTKTGVEVISGDA